LWNQDSQKTDRHCEHNHLFASRDFVFMLLLLKIQFLLKTAILVLWHGFVSEAVVYGLRGAVESQR